MLIKENGDVEILGLNEESNYDKKKKK